MSLNPSNDNVSVTYTYNNNSYTTSGNININSEGDYIANLVDSNFPAIYTGTNGSIFVGGIFIQLNLGKNNEITITTFEFLKTFTYNNTTPPTIPTMSPAPTNVTFNGMINNNSFNYNASLISQGEIPIAFVPANVYSYVYSATTTSTQQQVMFFSPNAKAQAATTTNQTNNLFKTLDPKGTFLTLKQQNQVANEAGKIAGHIVSIVEKLNNINLIINNKNVNSSYSSNTIANISINNGAYTIYGYIYIDNGDYYANLDYPINYYILVNINGTTLNGSVEPQTPLNNGQFGTYNGSANAVDSNETSYLMSLTLSNGGDPYVNYSVLLEPQ